MLPTSYDRQTESSYCRIQPTPSQEDGTALLCFVLINTCSILNFVFQLAIYHLQLHTRACAASQWLHAQYSSSAADAMFVCIRM